MNGTNIMDGKKLQNIATFLIELIEDHRYGEATVFLGRLIDTECDRVHDDIKARALTQAHKVREQYNEDMFPSETHHPDAIAARGCRYATDSIIGHLKGL